MFRPRRFLTCLPDVIRRVVLRVASVIGLAGIAGGVGVVLLPSHAAASSPSVATTLPQPVAQIARAQGIPETAISAWVQKIGAAEPLVTFNADVLRNPASTMKLATTFAALSALGPTYTWSTQVHLLSPMASGGVIKDLWIRGGGDPFLVLEEYWKILSALRQKGVRRVDGDLVLDTSFFDLPLEDPGAFDNQPDRPYNLVPNALLVNFNSVLFRVQAQADGKVGTRAEPPLPNLKLINRVAPKTGRCGGYQFGVAFAVENLPQRDQASFAGEFPMACRQFELTRTVLQPETYAYGLFRLYWQQLGGEHHGHLREGTLPTTVGRPFYEHRSRSLGDLIRLINKFSNNVMTRQLELTLGAERFGPPATPEKGHQAILEVLREHGVDTNGLMIANSAGLSRDSRISARQMAAILRAGWASAYMPEYISSLALVGMDGTMRSRLNGSAGAGRMHVKTGRLDHVSAIAGYVTAQSGERLSVVLLVNHRNAHLGPGNLLQNAFLRWAHDTH